MSTPVLTPEDLEDLRILEAVLCGDHMAFDALYHRWSGFVRTITQRALNRSGNHHPEDVQDAEQEIWLHLIAGDFRVLRCFEVKRGAPRAYLTTVATRKAIDLARKKRAFEPLPEEPKQTVHRPNPDRALDAQVADRFLARDTLRKLRRELPSRGQATLKARYLDGHSIPHAAETTGLTTRAIYNWCHQIRVRARQIRDEFESTARPRTYASA